MESMQLHTVQETLSFERTTGKLISLRSDFAPEQEFISSAEEHPAFVVQYLDEAGSYLQLASQQAEAVEVTCDDTQLTAKYSHLAGLALNVTFTVTARPDERFSRWNISVENQAGLRIVDVQFPFIVASYAIGGRRAVVVPFNAG